MIKIKLTENRADGIQTAEKMFIKLARNLIKVTN